MWGQGWFSAEIVMINSSVSGLFHRGRNRKAKCHHQRPLMLNSKSERAYIYEEVECGTHIHIHLLKPQAYIVLCTDSTAHGAGKGRHFTI